MLRLLLVPGVDTVTVIILRSRLLPIKLLSGKVRLLGVALLRLTIRLLSRQRLKVVHLGEKTVAAELRIRGRVRARAIRAAELWWHNHRFSQKNTSTPIIWQMA